MFHDLTLCRSRLLDHFNETGSVANLFPCSAANRGIDWVAANNAPYFGIDGEVSRGDSCVGKSLVCDLPHPHARNLDGAECWAQRHSAYRLFRDRDVGVRVLAGMGLSATDHVYGAGKVNVKQFKPE